MHSPILLQSTLFQMKIFFHIRMDFITKSMGPMQMSQTQATASILAG